MERIVEEDDEWETIESEENDFFTMSFFGINNGEFTKNIKMNQANYTRPHHSKQSMVTESIGRLTVNETSIDENERCVTSSTKSSVSPSLSPLMDEDVSVNEECRRSDFKILEKCNLTGNYLIELNGRKFKGKMIDYIIHRRMRSKKNASVMKNVVAQTQMIFDPNKTDSNEFDLIGMNNSMFTSDMVRGKKSQQISDEEEEDDDDDDDEEEEEEEEMIEDEEDDADWIDDESDE
ncbi:hypothetical protein SNEBB_001869 [Seison nebaliae]|nr:hypothetical protein SNEBB_001869 [Seison nebaliae]